MATVFDETAILNDIIDYSAISGGPEGSTTIVRSPLSGVSQRNVNRYDPLHRYAINTALLTPTQLNNLRAFFRCRDAQGRGFRLLDMTEFWAAADGTPTSPVGAPNLFGTGDGSTTVFGLYKTYSSGGVTRTRRIVKPISGTVAIYKNDVLQTVTTHYTIDHATGIVTFLTAPTNGHTLKWTGRFHVPVYFGADYFNTEMNDAVSAISMPQIPLIEIPAAEFELAV